MMPRSVRFEISSIVEVDDGVRVLDESGCLQVAIGHSEDEVASAIGVLDDFNTVVDVGGELDEITFQESKRKKKGRGKGAFNQHYVIKVNDASK